LASFAKILSLETATDVCSICLHRGPELIGVRQLSEKKAHSRYLAKLTDDLFNEAQVKIGEIDAVAVSKGPGSYTGLRIGTSFAKGLCFGLSIPLIAINTLESMAMQARSMGLIEDSENAFLAPMLDARRMEVYTMVLDISMKVIEQTRPMILEPDSFAKYLANQEIYFFGDGAAKWKQIAGDQQNARFIDNFGISAESVGQLALERFQLRKFDDVAAFEPDYLKPFLAGKPKSLLKQQDA